MKCDAMIPGFGKGGKTLAAAPVEGGEGVRKAERSPAAGTFHHRLAR